MQQSILGWGQWLGGCVGRSGDRLEAETVGDENDKEGAVS